MNPKKIPQPPKLENKNGHQTGRPPKVKKTIPPSDGVEYFDPDEFKCWLTGGKPAKMPVR